MKVKGLTKVDGYCLQQMLSSGNSHPVTNKTHVEYKNGMTCLISHSQSYAMHNRDDDCYKVLEKRNIGKVRLKGEKMSVVSIVTHLCAPSRLCFLVGDEPHKLLIAEVDLAQRTTLHTQLAKYIRRHCQDGKSSARSWSCPDYAICKRLSHRKKLRKGSEAQIADSGS